MRSTSSSPASMSTPACLYVSGMAEPNASIVARGPGETGAPDAVAMRAHAARLLRRPRVGAPPRIYPRQSSSRRAPSSAPTSSSEPSASSPRAPSSGAGTRIQSHTSVWDGVVLGEDVFVGPGAVFTNVRHPRAAFPARPELGPDARRGRRHLGAGCGARRSRARRPMRDHRRGGGRDPRRPRARDRRWQPGAESSAGRASAARPSPAGARKPPRRSCARAAARSRYGAGPWACAAAMTSCMTMLATCA